MHVRIARRSRAAHIEAMILALDAHTLLRANPPKGGDAEPRGYRAIRAMLAEPPVKVGCRVSGAG